VEGLNDLEQAVLDMLLSGDHPVLAVLQAQAAKARLVKREYTGVGFFCDFEVPPDAPILKGDFDIDDVSGEVEGLAHGAGFVLFIRDGRLDNLEGFSFDEPWPEEVGNFQLSYMKDPREPSLPDASPSAERTDSE
jgi:hypothetical protein